MALRLTVGWALVAAVGAATYLAVMGWWVGLVTL